MRQVTLNDLENMIEDYENGKEVKRDAVYAYDFNTGNYTALDNRTGEMWLEVFPTRQAAKEWLE